MIKPDIQSLKKWRDSLEVQKNELITAIRECDRQLQYFNGEQTEMALEPEAPKYSWNNLADISWDIFQKNIGTVLAKADLMKQLEVKGFPVRDKRFIFAFNGYLGSLVRIGKIEKVETGKFILRNSNA